MTDRQIITHAVIITVSAIVFFVAALTSIGRTNLGLEQGGAWTVAVSSFVIGMGTLLRLSWKCEKEATK